MKQKIEIKASKLKKKKQTISLDDMTTNTENLKESSKNLLDLINKSSNVAAYKNNKKHLIKNISLFAENTNPIAISAPITQTVGFTYYFSLKGTLRNV